MWCVEKHWEMWTFPLLSAVSNYDRTLCFSEAKENVNEYTEFTFILYLIFNKKSIGFIQYVFNNLVCWLAAFLLVVVYVDFSLLMYVHQTRISITFSSQALFQVQKENGFMLDGLGVLHKLECFVLPFLSMPIPQGKRCTMRNETSVPNIIISLTEQRVECRSLHRDQ